jgi:hypothetical protein
MPNGEERTERRSDYRVLETMIGEFEKRQALRDEMHNREIAGIRSDMRAGFTGIEKREETCAANLWKEVNVAKAAVPAHVEAYHSTGKILGSIKTILAILLAMTALLSFVKLFVLGG